MLVNIFNYVTIWSFIMVELRRLEEPTLSGLQGALRRDTFHVLHFIGHGGFRDRAQEGVLIFEDGQGGSQPVSAQHLGVLLRDHSALRFALLNACEGARGGRGDPFSGVAQTLVRQGIPAVLGMQAEVSDEAALTLAHELYRALADGYAVDAAVTEARKAVAGTGSVEWGTPALYLRAPDGQLFDIPLGKEQDTVDLAGDAVHRTVLVSDLVGAEKLLAKLDDASGAKLMGRVVHEARELLPRYSGQQVERSHARVVAVFKRAQDAVAHALAYHESVARLGEELGLALEAKVGIHFGEVWALERPVRDDEPSAQGLEITGRTAVLTILLKELAQGRQTLLTRAAFDLARIGARGETALPEMRWLAHGAYGFERLEEPHEVFEVGVSDKALLRAPPDTTDVRRIRSPEEEAMLGWRPAPELDVPQRPRWVLDQRIGEGGFGEAWLARHATGEKRVFKFCFEASRLRALKREVTLFGLLKGALGQRDDIARVLDWNFESAPFFIETEYAEGGDLAQWIELQGGFEEVPLAVRLELVAQVAEALSAAHSVGVLHKDVKPENVLVSPGLDGRPRVRLTDFGIGQVYDPSHLDQHGMPAMGFTATLAEDLSTAGSRRYLAPELLEGGTASVQADIYSLGVVLYQMVVGDFTRALAPGWRRGVKDKLLAGDVARMADHSPERRPDNAYEVVGWLRTLDERWAQHRAEVKARETRLALERSWRRRRYLAGAAAVLFVLALVSLLQERRATRGAARAERERAAAEQVSRFLVELFEVFEPSESPGGSLTARQLLDWGNDRISHLETPEVRAMLATTLGRVNTSLGRYEAALPLLDSAVAELRKLPGDPRPQLAVSLHELAKLHHLRGESATAVGLFQEALALRRGRLGDRHTDVAVNLHDLGLALHALGEREDARARLGEALGIQREVFGEEHVDVAASLHSLARVLEADGDTKSAEELLLRSFDIRRRVLSGPHPDIAAGLNDLGILLFRRGEREASEELLRRALAQKRRVYSQDHPEVGIGAVNLAVIVADPVEAEVLSREAKRIFSGVFPAGHWRIAHAESVRGACLVELGRFEEAESLLVDSLRVLRETKGEEDEVTRDARRRLVVLYERWGRRDDAARYRSAPRP